MKEIANLDEQHELDIGQYERLVQRRNAAYAAFEAMYKVQNPPPSTPVQPEPPARPADAALNKFDVGIMALLLFGAAVVSMTRTTAEFAGTNPQFGNYVVGFFAFVMLEVAGVAYAYFRTKLNYSDKRHGEVLGWIERGLVLALITAIFANLHQGMKAHGIELPFLNVVNAALGSFAPPVLAFIAGDILGSLVVRQRVENRKLQEAYESQMREWREAVAGLNAAWQVQLTEWRDGLNRSFAANADRLGAKIEVSKPVPPPSVSVQPVQLSAGHTGHGQGYVRESKASMFVRKHLDNHPEDLSIPVRDLAEKLSVGKSTVATVVREYKKG